MEPSYTRLLLRSLDPVLEQYAETLDAQGFDSQVSRFVPVQHQSVGLSSLPFIRARCPPLPSARWSI